MATSGCGQFSVVSTTPVPSAASVALPPIGFSHRYGNDPVAARDALQMERQLYAEAVFWEVAITVVPAQAGYVTLGNLPAVRGARHAMTSLQLVVATENRATITGLLAYGSHAGQETYAEALLNHVRAIGYDNFKSASVLIFFSEKDEHAKLTWTENAGYAFAVFDNDLKGKVAGPTPGQTPLPSPPAPPAAP